MRLMLLEFIQKQRRKKMEKMRLMLLVKGKT
jgi:hypothetical protein